MRMSSLFSQTLREAPAEAEVASHQLLLRAGFIRPLATGIFSYLPLARRSMARIENIMRAEIEAIGGQELSMPVVHSAEVWKQSGRWYQVGSEMARFKDRANRDMVLAMTHEEIAATLVRGEVRSYRQLPALIYHIQTKFRDDPRPRAGLIRVREFTMLDSYSLDADEAGLDRQYRAHYQAYFNLYHRCGLPVRAVKADTGMMGGQVAHEFMYLTPVGEDTLLFCDACGYAANRQVARFRKSEPPAEAPLPLEKVATPHTTTINDLAALLGIPAARTAKAVFMMATLDEADGPVERFVFAVVRGDMEVNETKLANAVHARDLRPATEEEIRATGAVPGYASPIGLKDVLVVVDDLAARSPNLVAGANQEGFHLLHTNYGRDYQATIVADLAAARDGDACERCGAPLRSSRGVEVGNIFKLGTRYTQPLGATYLDESGQPHAVVMGSYGIGVGRLLACIAEEHHDERGLIWPISVAPYQVHLVSLAGKSEQVARTAEQLYHDLRAAGVEVLYDDRGESAGIKFNDADLIGAPLRLTLGERSLKQGGVELRRRDAGEGSLLPLNNAVTRTQAEIQVLFDEIEGRVKAVAYEE